MKPDLEDKINDEDSDKEYEEYPYEKELREKRKKSFNGIIQFGICLFAAVLISFFIVHYVAQRTTVDGMSMYNTLNDGDNLIIEKLSYR